MEGKNFYKSNNRVLKYNGILKILLTHMRVSQKLAEAWLCCSLLYRYVHA